MSAEPKAPAGTNPLFDKRLLNAFVDSVIKTMQTMAQVEATPGKPYIRSDVQFKGEIAGLVGMVAPPLKGTLLISYDKQSILYIVESMIGEKHTTINGEVADAVGEMTNMIYGSAKTTLNQFGYNFEMAIPSVLTGDFMIAQPNKGTTLVIPFNLKNESTFYVEVTVTS